MIKKLARSLREFTVFAILSPLCMAGEVYMEVLIPGIISKIVDYGITPGDMGVVVRQGLMLVLCALTSLCFGVFSAVFAALCQQLLHLIAQFPAEVEGQL